MARKTANRVAKLYQRGVSLKEAHRPVLALIDPTNENVGIRFLMQWAINSGVMSAFLNLDGTVPNPPHSAKHLEALRLASLKAALERTQAAAPEVRPTSIVPAPAPVERPLADIFAGWEDDTPAQVATPAQPTTQAAVAGYKPATDADMRAMMQDIEQSLK